MFCLLAEINILLLLLLFNVLAESVSELF